eukprot:4882614-Alexandrium_andersonii.AAC.1
MGHGKRGQAHTETGGPRRAKGTVAMHAGPDRDNKGSVGRGQLHRGQGDDGGITRAVRRERR